MQRLLMVMVVVVCSSFVMLASCFANAVESSPQVSSYDASFQALENQYNIKLGIYAVDTVTHKEVSYRAEERFPYCSTAKVLLVSAVLQQDSWEQLDEVIHYTQEDILSYAPVTAQHVTDGMKVSELCEAALRVSDNTAANLLIRHIGGMSGFRKALAGLKDDITNPVRLEPDLNDVAPGEIEDTSTPKQMVNNLSAYTMGHRLLSSDKQAVLRYWMTGNATGKNLIRAGVPVTWIVAEKSGSGSYGTRNDLALITPPQKNPVAVTIMSTHSDKAVPYNEKAVAEASAIVAAYFTANN